MPSNPSAIKTRWYHYPIAGFLAVLAGITRPFYEIGARLFFHPYPIMLSERFEEQPARGVEGILFWVAHFGVLAAVSSALGFFGGAILVAGVSAIIFAALSLIGLPLIGVLTCILPTLAAILPPALLLPVLTFLGMACLSIAYFVGFLTGLLWIAYQAIEVWRGICSLAIEIGAILLTSFIVDFIIMPLVIIPLYGLFHGIFNIYKSMKSAASHYLRHKKVRHICGNPYYLSPSEYCVIFRVYGRRIRTQESSIKFRQHALQQFLSVFQEIQDQGQEDEAFLREFKEISQIEAKKAAEMRQPNPLNVDLYLRAFLEPEPFFKGRLTQEDPKENKKTPLDQSSTIMSKKGLEEKKAIPSNQSNMNISQAAKSLIKGRVAIISVLLFLELPTNGTLIKRIGELSDDDKKDFQGCLLKQMNAWAKKAESQDDFRKQCEPFQCLLTETNMRVFQNQEVGVTQKNLHEYNTGCLKRKPLKEFKIQELKDIVRHNLEELFKCSDPRDEKYMQLMVFLNEIDWLEADIGIELQSELRKENILKPLNGKGLNALHEIIKDMMSQSSNKQLKLSGKKQPIQPIDSLDQEDNDVEGTIEVKETKETKETKEVEEVKGCSTSHISNTLQLQKNGIEEQCYDWLIAIEKEQQERNERGLQPNNSAPPPMSPLQQALCMPDSNPSSILFSLSG